MKQFTAVSDVSDPIALAEEALAMKADPFGSKALGQDKTMVLLFFNPSLRTRLSTQKAGINLGMSVISMNAAQGWQLEFEDHIVMNTDKAEHIREAAAVVSQYADIIGIRTFPSLTDKVKDYSDFIINRFIQYASVPVISLESAIRHPLQSLADLVTIKEQTTKARSKVVLSWAPHPRALPQAVSNSFIEWMQAAGMDLTITHPKGYELSRDFVKDTPVEYDQQKAFEGADFIYTKNWSSYDQYGKVLQQDSNWMITPEKMALTDNGKFMHCLPVRRNVVVGDGVLDSPQSIVIEQANNRTYAAQAVIARMLRW
ncbi:N-acetylornithine carbamoyltransferase [Flavilitoribacter nigricans]|uniref:N-succinylornithine carbamoyltransferase n=1 Tax=Flavilitoribacter nigricans (strain ATCC 23147 / DSM 23189 / NBRC 102662 / NCIMB 1420 / SS-2) TaxID=1122177 RepID=A0A2D0NBV5_FLAN2|nr:N-acetylornithine carbamoyltransferase [Flavilitoribacter nigricans]PHN05659.1 acetylornithine carbamoyltransferase [Flavilitoribacter nigricans DSM 23189 = NBRC 102662]